MSQLTKKIGELSLHSRQLTHLIAIRSSTCSYSTQGDKSSYKCVILGGGTGGCAMAAKMARKFGPGHVAVVEPQDTHYYQPMFTLVGSGHKSMSQARQPMGRSIPNGAKWIKDHVASVEPDSNLVITSSGIQGDKSSYKCVILGGGTGGCAMAAKMARKFGPGHVAVVEPQDTHYYQPMFTLVGSGHKSMSQARQPMGRSIPNGAKWIKDHVASVEPDSNLVITSSGIQLEYDTLIVAVGMQLDYSKIPGSTEALKNDPHVCSNFSPDYVQKTYKSFQAFPQGGTAIFSMPPLPIKCPGAPQKIMYLFDDYLRKNSLREGSKILYNTNLPVIFGVKKYADALLEVVKDRDITVNFQHNLVSVDHDKGEATFAKVGADPVENVTMSYDLLHVSPSMSAPPFLKESSLSNEAGFVDVSKDNLQHTKYDNVFSLGDCSSAPTSKTAAAVAAEAGILSKTIDSFLTGEKPSGEVYDGYTSCPLITKEGKTILAEFDYNGQPLETFPVNQGKERYSMWLLKSEAMPFIYWRLLIKGRWHGPGVCRKLFHFGMGK